MCVWGGGAGSENGKLYNMYKYAYVVMSVGEGASSGSYITDGIPAWMSELRIKCEEISD